MATNKHATIRYHALDKCFNNHGRKYFMDDLIIACNNAIYEFSGIEDGVKRRQIFDDIAFMESEQGWSIPLERFKDGRKVYYRYSDKSFSIGNKGINPSEAEQLKETLSILSRFKGMPHFEWIEEIQIRLEDTFKLKSNAISSVSFEQNPYLKGLNYFTELFNFLQNQQVLEVEYQGFKQKNISSIVFHPWHLKQYNNRWFLFGLNEHYGSVSNLAIDRIISISNSPEKYIVNEDIDFEELFEDIVGVSINLAGTTERIMIKVSNEVWPYIESKPLHGSQKVKSKTADSVLIQLDVQINHELIALLFSHMETVEIIEPETLREKFKVISESILKKYK
ncbi:MAG: helix-turn-helix transcriptional regulator [Sphingobacterium sp.]